MAKKTEVEIENDLENDEENEIESTTKTSKKTKPLSELQAWNHINELFGEGSVFHPEEVEKIDIISSRSPMLDRALQIGGWGRGRIYQVAGKPGSGKTFMAMVAIAEWQSKDPENCAAFLDAEYTFDPKWASKLGIDLDRLFLVKNNDAKKLMTGLLGIPKKNKQTGKVVQIPGLLDMIKNKSWITHVVEKNGIKKEVRINCGKMGIIVLDSVAIMQAPSELESEVGKVQIAPLTRFLTTELKKLTPAVAQANVCFIAINHVKTKIGELFGNPETTPGGAAWKHACSVMLMVSSPSKSEDILFDKNEEKYGHKITIKVEKNKMAPPGKVAKFFIDFNSGVTKIEEQILELACLYGIIERPNNVSYIIDGEKIKSRASVLKYIESRATEIESRVREAYLSGKDIISSMSEISIDPAEISDASLLFDNDEYEDVE